MIPTTLRDQDRSFCCQINGNIKLSSFSWWNEAVEVIEATKVIKAAEVPDGMEITQPAAFDSLKLLKSLRSVMVPCLLRS